MSTKPHNKTQSTPTKGLVYPIKKTYDYYKTSENLWNSKYLTCDKLAQYYHNPHSEYLSGPNSPIKLSLEESIKKHKILLVGPWCSIILVLASRYDRYRSGSSHFKIRPVKFNKNNCLK